MVPGKPHDASVYVQASNQRRPTVGKKKPMVRPVSRTRVLREEIPKAPKTVGEYALGRTIGQVTGENVAIKILVKSKLVEVADVERVAREIHILKRNRHPNIIQLYEVLDTPTALYLIMENADGGEMFDYIVARQRIPEKEACNLFHQIVEGVEYLHSMEVTHRDLKPENLLMQKSVRGWVIKIVDFGLSNTHDGGRLLKTACGSPCYASPEMIAGKEYVGPKADIWSLGVILFALLCGYLPFEDDNTSVLYKTILSGEYTFPPFLSKLSKDLIAHILETDPEKRYSIQQIQLHPWYTSNSVVIPKSFNTLDYDHPNEDVLLQAEKLGISKVAILNGIANKTHDRSTTSYYLLLKRYLRCKEQKLAHKKDVNESHSMKSYEMIIPILPPPTHEEVRQTNATSICKTSKCEKSVNVEHRVDKPPPLTDRPNSGPRRGIPVAPKSGYNVHPQTARIITSNPDKSETKGTTSRPFSGNRRLNPLEQPVRPQPKTRIPRVPIQKKNSCWTGNLETSRPKFPETLTPNLFAPTTTQKALPVTINPSPPISPQTNISTSTLQQKVSTQPQLQQLHTQPLAPQNLQEPQQNLQEPQQYLQEPQQYLQKPQQYLQEPQQYLQKPQLLYYPQPPQRKATRLLVQKERPTRQSISTPRKVNFRKTVVRKSEVRPHPPKIHIDPAT